MKIILLEKIKKLGSIGDTIEVKKGFARHFLLRYKKALKATKENILFFEKEKENLEKKNILLKEKAIEISKKVNNLNLTIIRHAGKNGKLYGSVNKQDISKKAKEKNIIINHHQILLEQPIKKTGIHKATIFLHPEVEININVNIAKSNEEAEMQKNKNI